MTGRTFARLGRGAGRMGVRDQHGDRRLFARRLQQVENSAIGITEFTIAGNLSNMFKSVVAVGNNVDTRSNIRTGSVLLDGLTVAGE